MVIPAVTPDGHRAISGSSDKTLKIWDIENGNLLHTLKGHTEWVEAVAVTPDGCRAISGSDDNTLKIWDIETGTELHTLKGHTEWVRAVAVTPDCRHVISGSSDKTLKIWDIETGNLLHTLKGHSDNVWVVAVSPDGRRAISGSDDKTLKIWDMGTGTELHTLKGHTHLIKAVAVTSDGRRAISCSLDKTLIVWDMEYGKRIATFTGEDSLFAFAIAPDGINIVAGGNSGKIYILHIENIVQYPSVVTVLHKSDQAHAFVCPLCRKYSEIPASALGTGLQCLYCGKAIKLNSFTIDADWQTVTKACSRQTVLQEKKSAKESNEPVAHNSEKVEKEKHWWKFW